MNVLFMGTPEFAKVVLERLCKDSFFNIVGLFTQEDKPFGRKRELKAPATKEFVLEFNAKNATKDKIQSKIPIYQPKTLQNAQDELEKLEIDVILVVAYGKILPKNIIEKYHCINLHASILPKSRGASPLQDMILKGESEVGVSVMNMNERLDAGEILSIWRAENKDYDICELTHLLSTQGAELVVETLKNLDSITPQAQDESLATYCAKISKSDGMVDFSSACEIWRKFLAYKIWPNIFLDSGLKLLEISLNERESCNKKGEILKICDDFIVVGCEKGSLNVKILQPQGKNQMSSKSYINGKRLGVGDILV